MNQTGKFFTLAAVAGVALAIMARRRQLTAYTAADFFDPEAVVHIADSLPGSTEDEFVLAAWDYVGREIAYDPYGSDMFFVNNTILCDDCFLPKQVIISGEGNCVAKSAILASILANRISLDRLQIVVGTYLPIQGGHAWVEMMRNGAWHLLEATAVPKISPWILAEETDQYLPAVYITWDRITCGDPMYCASFAQCNCQEFADAARDFYPAQRYR